MKLFSLCLTLALGLAVPAAAQQWTGTIKVGGAVTEFSGDLSSGPAP